MQGGSQPQKSSWYKPRDNIDKRRSCANCGSADHYVANCTAFKQGMKSLGYAPDEEDVSQTEEHTSRNRFEEHGSSEWGITEKNGERGSASQNCHGGRGWEFTGDKL